MKAINTVGACGYYLCHKCALKEHLKVSREYRPLVGQWVQFGVVAVCDAISPRCVRCKQDVKS